MPPLLQLRLVNKCGVKVVRKKPSSVHKHHIGSRVKEFKKYLLGPIPKCPLPAIEPPSSLDAKMIGCTPSVTGTHSSNRSFSPESNNSLGSVLDDSEDNADQQGVFMTQVDGEEPDPSSQPAEGVATQPISAREDFDAKLRKIKDRFKNVPEKYKGYELLLDVQDDPHVRIPSDTQSCVRALQYSLKHPLVLSDKPSQAASVANSSSFTMSQLTAQNYLRKKTPPLEPLPPLQTHGKVREIRGVLEDICTHCTTLETNLSVAISPPPEKKNIFQLQKESRQLLAEMQACLSHIHRCRLVSLTLTDAGLSLSLTLTDAGLSLSHSQMQACLSLTLTDAGLSLSHSQMQACYDRVRASSLKTVQSLAGKQEQYRQGTRGRAGTPRRVKFSRDSQVLTPSSPRNTEHSPTASFS